MTIDDNERATLKRLAEALVDKMPQNLRQKLIEGSVAHVHNKLVMLIHAYLDMSKMMAPETQNPTTLLVSFVSFLEECMSNGTIRNARETAVLLSLAIVELSANHQSDLNADDVAEMRDRSDRMKAGTLNEADATRETEEHLKRIAARDGASDERVRPSDAPDHQAWGSLT